MGEVTSTPSTSPEEGKNIKEENKQNRTYTL
jgi:hypothetical protein